MLSREQQHETNLKAREAVSPTRDRATIDHYSIYHILGLALLLRSLVPTLAYLYTGNVATFYAPDTESYVMPARELIANHRYFAYGVPEIIRTPGYPLLLIPGLLLNHLVLTTVMVQIVASCFTVYMVYRTAQLLFDCETIAITAATLYSIEPLSIVYTGVIITETLFTALVMLWLYFLLRYLNRPTPGDLLLSALFLTASVYVRPISYFLPEVIGLGLLAWIALSSQEGKRRLVGHVTAFLVVSLALTAVWQVRNGAETGFFGFSAIAPIEMYFNKGVSVLAAEHHVPFYEMQRRLGYLNSDVYLADHPEQKTWALAKRLRYMNREGEKIVLSAPLTYALIHCEGVGRMMFDPGATDFLKFFGLYPKAGGLLGKLVDVGLVGTVRLILAEQPLLFWSSIVLGPLQLLFLLPASMVFLSGRLILRPQTIAALLTITYYVGIAGGPSAVCRYRHPAMPIIAVLSGYGLCVMWRHGADRKCLEVL